MGGKSKQSQRTKNNVRPSSSARSAELLGHARDPALLLGGKASPALFPSLTIATLDQNVPPEFSLCMKKLNKKDPITRTKALQELNELVGKSEVDIVVAILPLWTHHYKNLAIDMDRKVREVTQLCHASIVSACGRRLAPALRDVLPAWLAAGLAAPSPAQALAAASLHKTFPSNKLPEVISFCKAEIMSSITENLIGTPETSVIRRQEGEEDAAERESLARESALRSLAALLAALPAAADAWLWAGLAAPLAAPAFWALATHASGGVRAAWFASVAALPARLPAFGAAHGRAAWRVCLSARETDARAAAELWGCLLSLMHTVPGWQAWLDKKDLLAKRIINILENGGWGSARSLCSLLLPLLSLLPDTLATRDFYLQFFNAFFVGLDNKNIQISKSEKQIWINGLSECLRYLSTQQNEFSVDVVTHVHRTWLEYILAPPRHATSAASLSKHSASHMTSLLKYWLKMSKEEHGEKYDQLIRNFWQNIGATITTQTDKLSPEGSITNVLDGHTLLLQSLKTSFTQEEKKKRSITFEMDTKDEPVETDVKENVEEKKEEIQIDASSLERFDHNLKDLVQRICVCYFEFLNKNESAIAILGPLLTLLIEFDSEKLFTCIANSFGADSVYGLYEKVLKPWLCDEARSCETLVRILFLMRKYMSEEQQDAMFHSFEQFPERVCEWCLSLSLTHPHSASRAARAWLLTRAAGAVLRRVCARAAHCAAARNLLLMCLQRQGAEMLVSREAMRDVLQQLAAALHPAAACLDRLATLTAQVITSYNEMDAEDALSVGLNLFKLNLYIPPGDPRLSLDTCSEARGAWQHVASDERWRGDFLARATTLVHSSLMDSSTSELDISLVSHLASLSLHLTSACPGRASRARALLALPAPARADTVQTHALRYDVICSRLNCPFDDDNDHIKQIVENSSKSDVPELTKEDLVLYLHKFLFRSIFFRELCLQRKGDDDEDCDDSEADGDERCCDDVLRDEYLQEEFLKILYDYAVIDSLNEGYAFWDDYDLIVQVHQRNDLKEIINHTSIDVRDIVLKSLTEVAAIDGYYWSYARTFYDKAVSGIEDGVTNESERDEQEVAGLDFSRMESIVTGNGFFHSLQAEQSRPGAARLRTADLVMLRSVCLSRAADEQLAADVRRRAVGDVRAVAELCARRPLLLPEADISSAPWTQVVANAAICECLSAGVAAHGWDWEAAAWDFTALTLCSLLTALGRSPEWGSVKVALLSCSVLKLYCEVSQFVSSILPECERRAPPPHIVSLASEWRDIFRPELSRGLLTLLLRRLRQLATAFPLNCAHACVLSALQAACERVQWEEPGAGAGEGPTLEELARAAAEALRAARAPAVCLAYQALRTIERPLSLRDAETIAAWNAGDGESETAAARPALSYSHASAALDALYSRAAAHLETEPPVNSPEYCRGRRACFAYLSLSVALRLGMAHARAELALHTMQICRENKFGERLLTISMQLLPAEVTAFSLAQRSDLPDKYHAFFQDAKPRIDWLEATGELACRGVMLALSGAAAPDAASWHGAAPPAVCKAVRRVTEACVTPALVRAQFKQLQARAREIEDAEVTLLWSSYEVQCVYSIDDTALRLSIQMPRDFPLAPPRLSCAAHLPAPPHWLPMFLTYQNGTLFDALQLWCASVSARVSSASQCYICYARLHARTQRLPALTCHQCRHRFHAPCVRKWFTSSTRANCPLCRTKF